MEKKPDRRIKKTRKSLYDAFYNLLKRKDYSDITVRELTEEADLTRKTFYLHYNTLNDLLREFLSAQYDRLQGMLGEVNMFSEEFSYPDFFTHLTELLGERRELVQKLMNDNNARYILQQVMETNERKTLEHLKDRFDLKPEVLRIYFCYYTRGITGSFMEWFANPDSLPLEEFCNTIRNINLQMRQALQKYQKQQA
ncbi:MAG: TetR/AcrR family transcriptional regulator [Clostridiales bacterium]|nr:TetR/AcrR family transcriptional regulator [Clostridiales bacterium]